jgi:glutaredoxin
MKLFDALSKVVDTTDAVMDKVRTASQKSPWEKLRLAPRKRLDVVPEPIGVPDPFAPPPVAPTASAAPAEKPLGDPSLAAEVYGKRTCEWTGRAVALLAEKGIDARFVNIGDPDNAHFEMKLVAATKQYTLPYVYLKGEFIGGYDALAERLKAGATPAADENAAASTPASH